MQTAELTFGRRAFLGAAAASQGKRSESYVFVSSGWRVGARLEWHDRFAGNHLWASSAHELRRLCLPSGSEACATSFRGALAIVRFSVQPATQRLRERLKLLDESEPGLAKGEFERSIALAQGSGSSIHAFDGPAGQWCVYRQDLFIDDQRVPFAVMFWKQAHAGIRLLDLMPGGEAWTVKR
ncbi:MAG: hypothetical protein JNL98_04730 [Bryobacterales bacterium]|nr:hypothetical protein [Bryobacterales bacterium]